MTSTATGTAPADVTARVGALDLEPIVFKLTHPDPGEAGMTLAEADQAVARYRAFLVLLGSGDGAAIAPTAQIDAVWHAHILDTAKYAADCDAAFGHLIHHFPYFGMRGPDDAAALEAAAARTRELLGIEDGPGAPRKCVQGGGQTCNGYCDSHDGKAAALDRPRPDRTTPAAAVIA